MPSYTTTLTSSGDSAALITPATGKQLRIWSLSVTAKAADITVTFKTGTTAKYTVLCPATGVGGISHPSGREPIFDGAVDEALKVNLSGAASSGVSVNVWYSEIG